MERSAAAGVEHAAAGPVAGVPPALRLVAKADRAPAAETFPTPANRRDSPAPADGRKSVPPRTTCAPTSASADAIPAHADGTPVRPAPLSARRLPLLFPMGHVPNDPLRRSSAAFLIQCRRPICSYRIVASDAPPYHPLDKRWCICYSLSRMTRVVYVVAHPLIVSRLLSAPSGSHG